MKNDLLPSLLVVLATGITVCVLLLFARRRQQEARLRVSGYCARRGWQCEEIRHPYHNAFVIQSGQWCLTTGLETSQTSTSSGSPDTAAYTRWESLPPAQGDTVCWFGTVQPGADTRLAGVFRLFAAMGIGDTRGVKVAPLDPALSGRFVLLTRDTPAPGDTIAFLTRWLQNWPKDWALHGRAGTDTVSLLIPGTRMDQPDELEQLVQLGEQWAQRSPLPLPTDC